MEKVRIVIWDCDDLMWFHKKEEPEILAKALKIPEVAEFSIEFYNFFAKFMEYFKNKKVNMKETLKLIEHEMPILDIYGILPEQFMAVHYEMKFEGSDFNKDTLVLMEYLKEKNIKSIVKSDWWRKVQEDMLKNYGVLDYIEELHCCDNAYLKSNPLSSKGLIKAEREEQYLIIGDSLTTDIAFANHAGIKSIWLNKGKNKNETKYHPTHEVESLLEAMKII